MQYEQHFKIFSKKMCINKQVYAWRFVKMFKTKKYFCYTFFHHGGKLFSSEKGKLDNW